MTEFAYSWQNNNLILHIKVQPKTTKQQILGIESGYLHIKLRAVPEAGAANKELIVLLAKTLGVAKTQIQLLSGAQSRYKKLLIPQPSIIPDWLQ